MNGTRLALLAAVSLTALAGPPFQTDDPQPIDYKNYEFCTFASSDGTGLETDTVTPGFEFNWGALPLPQAPSVPLFCGWPRLERRTKKQRDPP